MTSWQRSHIVGYAAFSFGQKRNNFGEANLNKYVNWKRDLCRKIVIAFHQKLKKKKKASYKQNINYSERDNPLNCTI